MLLFLYNKIPKKEKIKIINIINNVNNYDNKKYSIFKPKIINKIETDNNNNRILRPNINEKLF